MSKEINVSCLKCRSLWIGIVIGLIAVVIIGIAVFDFSIYEQNQYYIIDLVKYGFFLFALSLTIFFSLENITTFCSRPYSIEHGGNGGYLENLALGIGLAVISIAFMMILFYFLPMTLQEWEFRLSGYDQDFIERFDCKTFNSHYDNWYGNFPHIVIDGTGFGGDSVINKAKECQS